VAHIFEDKKNNAYPYVFLNALDKLMLDGREASPRGMLTKELDHCVFKIDPRKSLFVSPKRNLNFWFLLAENLWYWSGRNATGIPSTYVKNYKQFSDENLHQGAYSPQILEQIRFVINTLKEDKDTRQAVMSLWRPNPNKSKDTPCTLTFDFKIRDGKLNLHATMRSNDIIFGNNYDIPSFSLLQIAVAGILGIETGNLFLTAHSLHIYERHFKLAEELLEESYHYLKYPEELIIPQCNVGSLSKHIENIEMLLSAHYTMTWDSRAFYHTFEDFYQQYYLMMRLFAEDKNDPETIEELKKINSPFGYTHDYLSGKK